MKKQGQRLAWGSNRAVIRVLAGLDRAHVATGRVIQSSKVVWRAAIVEQPENTEMRHYWPLRTLMVGHSYHMLEAKPREGGPVPVVAFSLHGSPTGQLCSL